MRATAISNILVADSMVDERSPELEKMRQRYASCKVGAALLRLSWPSSRKKEEKTMQVLRKGQRKKVPLLTDQLSS